MLDKVCRERYIKCHEDNNDGGGGGSDVNIYFLSLFMREKGAYFIGVAVGARGSLGRRRPCRYFLATLNIKNEHPFIPFLYYDQPKGGKKVSTFYIWL